MNRHSYPSLSANGSEVAAAFSAAPAFRTHYLPNPRKKKAVLVSRGDGEDVKAAIRGSPAQEGSREKILSANLKFRLRGAERSCRSESPSSSNTDVEAYFSGDDNSINTADGLEPANEVDLPTFDSYSGVRSHAADDWFDPTPWADILIPIEEIYAARYQMLNTPTPPTEEMQKVLDMDKDATWASISSLHHKLSPDPEVDFSTYDEKQLAEVYKRLSRYCIKAHELSSPGEELDDEKLNAELESPLHVYEKVLCQHKKEDPEWYFHLGQCKLAGLDDYQRLVLRDDSMYKDWNYYGFTDHTYRGDLQYVQFCEEMSKKIKWIDDETALFGDHYRRYEQVAYLQSLEIAVQFRNIFSRSIATGLSEHLDSLRFHLECRKDWDGVYLEIWKRIAKYKVNFVEVLRQLHEENIFPYRRTEIKAALDDYPAGESLIKYNYENFVDGIDAKFSEEEAHPLIIEAVEKMFPRKKNYLDYARKKMEIAARIGLIPKSSLEVAEQCGGK